MLYRNFDRVKYMNRYETRSIPVGDNYIACSLQLNFFSHIFSLNCFRRFQLDFGGNEIIGNVTLLHKIDDVSHVYVIWLDDPLPCHLHSM